MKYTLHPFETEHAKPIIDIYNYYAKNTHGTYTEKTMSVNEINVFRSTGRGYSIRFKQKEVVGFALYRIHLNDQIADVYYYIDKAHTGRGAGTFVLNVIKEDLKKQRVKLIHVSLSSLNTKSLNFHLKNGFIEYGRIENAGEKFGKTYDIVFLQNNI